VGDCGASAVRRDNVVVGGYQGSRCQCVTGMRANVRSARRLSTTTGVQVGNGRYCSVNERDSRVYESLQMGCKHSGVWC
jgi:hypothetical protein